MPTAEDTRPVAEKKGPKREAVEKAAESEQAAENMTPAERADATAWFLEDPPEQVAQITFEMNVSPDSKKKRWIPWTVRALSRERIKEIREQAGEDSGEEMSANSRIAAEGTLKPNLIEVKGQYADPADALEQRFAFKPGLIDQISNQVIRCTGYDDEDVRELQAVKT